MDYVEELEKIVNKMGEMSTTFHEIYYRLPRGSLSIFKDGKYIRYKQVYSECGKEVHKGITRNKPLIRKLAYKAYIKSKMNLIDQDLDILTTAKFNLSGCEDSVIKSLLPQNYNLLNDSDYFKPNGKLMSPDWSDTIAPKTLFELNNSDPSSFQREPYRANSKEMQNLRIRTSQGFYVRSKSEASIVDLYVNLGIPFHYDELISLDGAYGTMYISPDFIAIRDDGTPVFHEHCGLMDNEAYVQNYYRKLDIYRLNGIVPWKNLIITYDTPEGGLNLSLVEEEIKAKVKEY